MRLFERQDQPFPQVSVVSLAAYARAINVCECGLFGVKNAPACDAYENCRDLWTLAQRHYVQYYLAEAQHEIESELHYHLGGQWETAEKHAWERSIQLNWALLRAPGVQATATISAGAAVDHTADPATVGPLATTVTDSDEIYVYHPDSDLPITPSAITLSGGLLTIEIPRCRMVKPELQDTEDGVAYATLTNFSQTVDVKRVYNDTSDQATLIRKVVNCEEETLAACVYVRQARLSRIEVQLCSTTTTMNCGCYTDAEINYYSGRDLQDSSGRYTMFGRQAQDAIIRLAHVKMPNAPCACDPASEVWQRDRLVIVDAQGRSTRGSVSPFGPEEGAWIAWQFVNSPGMRVRRGAAL